MKLAFLPGVSGSGSFWRPVADLLSEEHDVLLLDWPGLGDIPSSPNINSFDDLASMVIDWLSGPSVLIAQSMGGVVAVRAALRRPDLISGLVLCATSGGVDMATHAAHSWHDNHRAKWPTAPRWVYERGPDLTADLTQLTMPSTLLWATADPISPLSVGIHLGRHLPNSQLITTTTEDHHFAAHRPRQTAREIAALIDRICAG